jgi:carbonic anhydrase/acetyltransferase-like protein (isoleucine patch superfamily)
VREYAHIGEECTIGKGAYIDAQVYIGSRVKIQNHASIFEGVTIEDGVFIGPYVCFTNDLLPRAITPDGKLKGASNWEITPTQGKYGASIGAGSIVLCGMTIGEFALIGAGSMVTSDVPAYALVFGNPARQRRYCSLAPYFLLSSDRVSCQPALVGAYRPGSQDAENVGIALRHLCLANGDGVPLWNAEIAPTRSIFLESAVSRCASHRGTAPGKRVSPYSGRVCGAFLHSAIQRFFPAVCNGNP